MTITLNHTIVPAHDKNEAAKFFADLFGLRVGEPHAHFAPVHVNDTLTLLFDNADRFERHHYAFHVSDAEFDAVLGRVKAADIPYGSGPRSLEDRQLNSWNGGRGFYFKSPDGHVMELMTVAQ